MHSVAILPAFERAAKQAGMADGEIDALVDFIAGNPLAGNVVPGTGGCRKIRWAAPGRGKSGGYRTITFYTGGDLPVFLITVFAKGERSDLSQSERNQLEQMTKLLVEEYEKKVVPVGKRQ